VDQPTAEAAPSPAQPAVLTWTADAEQELRKIPFFVRGKAKRNTEKYATDHGMTSISIETLYDAKAHYSR
jgi:light-independent protochlorophyllide reductase subunit B